MPPRASFAPATSRTSATTLLADLRRGEVVDVRRGVIRVLDRDRLFGAERPPWKRMMTFSATTSTVLTVRSTMPGSPPPASVAPSRAWSAPSVADWERSSSRDVDYSTSLDGSVVC